MRGPFSLLRGGSLVLIGTASSVAADGAQIGKRTGPSTRPGR